MIFFDHDQADCATEIIRAADRLRQGVTPLRLSEPGSPDATHALRSKYQNFPPRPRGSVLGARLGLGSRPPLDQWCQAIEWAGYGPDRGIGDAGVKRCGVESGMAQQS